MVGIIHPCKIYGAMAVGRPILYFGPRPSHITDLLDRHSFGVSVPHGDVEGAVAAIRGFRAADAVLLRSKGDEARSVLQIDWSQSILCTQFCDRLEEAL